MLTCSTAGGSVITSQGMQSSGLLIFRTLVARCTSTDARVSRSCNQKLGHHNQRTFKSGRGSRECYLNWQRAQYLPSIAVSMFNPGTTVSKGFLSDVPLRQLVPYRYQRIHFGRVGSSWRPAGRRCRCREMDRGRIGYFHGQLVEQMHLKLYSLSKPPPLFGLEFARPFTYNSLYL